MIKAIVIAKPDARSGVTVYERWTPEWMEAYTLDAEGKKQALFVTKNPYGMVPYVKIEYDPEWIRLALTEAQKASTAGSAADSR